MKGRYMHMCTLFVSWLLCAAGCTDNSYSGPFDPTNLSNDPIPVSIRLGQADQSTKGLGMIDDLSGMRDGYMYVNAVRNGSAFSYHDDKNFLVHNRRTKVNYYDTKLDWIIKDGDTPVYYPWKELAYDDYEIFAWFLDDAVVSEPVRTANTEKISVTVDGTQDVMLSKAYAAQTSDTEERLYSFSYATAVRNIVPVISPRHMLASMSICFKPSVSNMTQRMFIKDIKIECHTTFDMVVSSHDDSWKAVVPTGEKSFVELPSMRDRRDSLTIESVSHPEDQKSIWVGDMLMPASESAIVRIDAVQIFDLERSDGTKYQKEAPLDPYYFNIEGIDGLNAGCHYTVTFTIYGHDGIQMDVVLDPWKSGGRINIDKDEDPEFN